jgi:hypothetical protein
VARAQSGPANVTTGWGYLQLCEVNWSRPQPDGCTFHPAGIEDGIRAVMRRAPQPLVCFTQDANLARNLFILLKFLRAHPERLAENTADLYLAALADAYPCTKPLPRTDNRF